jgi:hypothetical protein
MSALIGLIIITSGSAAIAQTRSTAMTKYTDSLGRFSISYPTNWSATTNRFQTEVVQFREPTGANLRIAMPNFIPTITDPEVAINQGVNAIGYGQVFIPEYKMHKTQRKHVTT